jgi:hypothetical protein
VVSRARSGFFFYNTVRVSYVLLMSDSVVKKKKAVMLGLGLDSDGHKRVTTGENFALVGGSKETHEAMTEKAVKINEKLAQKGKRLEEVSAQEFEDIAHSVGLRRHNPEVN